MKIMNELRRFCGLLLVVFIVTFAVFAQTNGLPALKKGERYKTVRAKLIKAGWKPYHSPDADECAAGDKRCENRPEMESCSGTGLAFCSFLWQRDKKTLRVVTSGENPVFDNQKLVEEPAKTETKF